MSKTLMQKFKLGVIGLLTIGILAACNTTDDFEENPEMGPPSATEEPVEDESGGTTGESEPVEEAE